MRKTSRTGSCPKNRQRRPTVIPDPSSGAALSKRIGTVAPSAMFELAGEVGRIRASGEEVIDLSLGQPEAPAPRHVALAFQEAARRPLTSYTSSAGSPELRKLIARRYTKASGVRTSPSEVVVTSGSKHALFVTLLALVDSGEEIVVPEPYFPPYAEISALVGARLKTVPVKWRAGRFSPDVEDLLEATTSRTKVLLLNYPNNPAGWTLDRPEVKRITEFCAERRVFLVSDEIYDRIVFDGRHHVPAWSFSGGTNYVIGIGSFSKTYSMIPYRLGYVVAKEDVVREVLKAVRATVTMVSPYVQEAGCAALSGPQSFVASRLKKYQERRDRCLRMLRRHQIAVPTPAGAFYLFIRMPGGSDVEGFAKELLRRDRVAVLPGGIFGKKWEKYVRLSLGTDDADLYRGLQSFIDRYASI